MAIFTAYKETQNGMHPVGKSFNYGIVFLITEWFKQEEYSGNLIHLDKEQLPGLRQLLEKVNQGFNTSEVVKRSNEHPWYHWSYQIKPGERSFKEPIEQIIQGIEAGELPLLLLED